jgi:gas vesicle protein
MRHEEAYGNGHDFMYGLLAGAAIGTAIGLLLAPKTGAQLRSQLGASAEKLRQQADETYRRAAGAVNDMVGQGRKAAQAGREKFDEARSQFSGETMAEHH